MERKLQIQRATRMINDSLHGSRTPALSFQQALRIMPATLPRTQTSAQGTQAEASSYTTNDGGKKKKPVSFRQRRPRVDANSPSLSGSSPPSSALPEDRRKNSVKLFLGGSSVSLPLKGAMGRKKEEADTNRGLPWPWPCLLCLSRCWLVTFKLTGQENVLKLRGPLFCGRGITDSSSGPAWI